MGVVCRKQSVTSGNATGKIGSYLLCGVTGSEPHLDLSRCRGRSQPTPGATSIPPQRLCPRARLPSRHWRGREYNVYYFHALLRRPEHRPFHHAQGPRPTRSIYALLFETNHAIARAGLQYIITLVKPTANISGYHITEMHGSARKLEIGRANASFRNILTDFRLRKAISQAPAHQFIYP